MNQFDEFTENLDRWFIDWKNTPDQPPINIISAVLQTENPPSLGASFESSIKFFPYKVEETPPVAHKKAVNCGGHDDTTRTLTLSGITFAGAPDPNGVYTLPQASSSGSVCGWELDSDPNYVFNVSFNSINSPPWTIAVSAKTEGNPWDGQAVFEATGVGFGVAAPSSLPTPPVPPQFFGGGNGTIS